MRFRSSFTYDFDVFRKLTQARRERGGWRWWHCYFILSALNVGVLVVSLWSSGTLADLSSWTAADIASAGRIAAHSFAWLMVAIAAIDYIFDSIIFRWVFRRYSVAGQPVEADIGDDRIVTRRAGMAGSVSWPAVHGVAVLHDKSAICIWLGKFEGILLPASSFASPAQFEAACAYLKEKTGGA